MKVYVITAGEYSDYCIQAVTLNREKAELICAINNRNIRYSEDRSKIEEYDTDEIQCESIGDVGMLHSKVRLQGIGDCILGRTILFIY